MLLDFVSMVVGIASQPFWLHWRDEADRQVSHVPYYLARSADGSVTVVDCRPVERRPPRDVAKFDATERACGLVGWSYRLVGAIDAIEAGNVRWLAWLSAPALSGVGRGSRDPTRCCLVTDLQVSYIRGTLKEESMNMANSDDTADAAKRAELLTAFNKLSPDQQKLLQREQHDAQQNSAITLVDASTKRWIWAGIFALLGVALLGALLLILRSYTIDLKTTTGTGATAVTAISHPDVSAAWALAAAVVSGVVGLLAPTPVGASQSPTT